MRKAFFFTMDALIAVTIISFAFLSVFIVKPSIPSENTGYERMHYISEDAMQLFGMTKLSGINSTISQELLANTNITSDDMNKSLVEIVGFLWAEGKTQYVENISRDFFFGIIPSDYYYAISVNDIGGTKKILYSSTGAPPESGNIITLTKASRLVSGYKENTTSKGYVARAFLIDATKKTQSYSYFGGFEGSGNITKILALPNSIDSINDVYMEMDVPSNFTLYVNGIYSGLYSVENTDVMRAKNWTVPAAYYSNFVNGSNNITLAFADINSAYVGGGFIRAKYNTSMLDTSDERLNPDGNATGKYYFPGIDGLINIYSAFYVPGNLNSMGMRLHYDSRGTVYVRVGNVKVYENTTNTTQDVYLNNTYLDAILDYSQFNWTMPLRFGTKNLTGLSEGSDVVLITDLSGSMSSCDVDAPAGPCDCGAPIPCFRNKIKVAKESDSEFVSVILSNEGQRAGLVSYDDTILDASPLTNDNATLQSKISSYATGGYTCISCGIQRATDMLSPEIGSMTLVENMSSWRYNDSYALAMPPDDAYGNKWYDTNYSLEPQWSTGNAAFGAGAGAIPIATPLSSGAGGVIVYPDLWDDNLTTIPVGFETGYNSTANTFGWNQGDDGWDYAPNNTGSGPYGYDGKVQYNRVVNGKIEMTTRTGSPAQNRCTSYDCSGAYGIQFNITPAMYSVLSSGGSARVSFSYEWDGNNANPFSNSDEVWIKGRWTDRTGTPRYLGTEKSSAGGDGSLEIDFRTNPNTDIPPTSFIQNVTNWIQGPGVYYLDFGGKVYVNTGSTSKWGYFRFDDILVEIRNGTDNYYFRKNFTISDITKVGKGFLKVASDDMADVYLNGRLVESDPGPSHDGKYWNRMELVDKRNFVQGNNVLAVKAYNSLDSARFDLMLQAINDSRNKAMMVMSDGWANYCYPPVWDCADSMARQQAINFSCSAYEKYGIVSHAVGFGNGVDNATLQAIASCGHGSYYASNNAEELKEIYGNIASSIISYTTQEANVSSSVGELYADSFIEYNYTPLAKLTYGNITLSFESYTFGNSSGNYSVEIPKNGSYNITPNMAVIDVKTTSYSSDYWTSLIRAKSETTPWTTVFNLSTFSTDYTSLGDPYIANIPANLVVPGEMNYVEVNTARNSTEFTGGSPDNRVHYSIRVKSSVDYGVPKETEEEANADAIQRLKDYLASFGNGTISEENIETSTTSTGGVPWMYGPAIITLEVWKS